MIGQVRMTPEQKQRLTQLADHNFRCTNCGSYNTKHLHTTWWGCKGCTIQFVPEMSEEDLDLLDNFKPKQNKNLKGGL